MTAQPPALYARWCRIDNGAPWIGDKWIAERWQFAYRHHREFWTELDGITTGLAALATEMHAEAQRIAPAGSRPDEMPDMADLIRAEVLHECAARIRQILGTEAS